MDRIAFGRNIGDVDMGDGLRRCPISDASCGDETICIHRKDPEKTHSAALTQEISKIGPVMISLPLETNLGWPLKPSEKDS